MEQIALEIDTLAELLMDASLTKVEKVRPEWFTKLAHQEIAEALVELSVSREPNIYDIQDYVRSKNPLSDGAKEEYLLGLFSGVNVYDAKGKLEHLETRYYERRLREATSDFTKTPNKQNGIRLKRAIEELDKSKIKDTDGDFTEALEEMDYELDNLKEDGIYTYPRLDELLAGGIQPARLIVVGARPGVGKSAFMNNLTIQAAGMNEGVATDIFTLEMTKKQLVSRFLSNLAEVNSYRMAKAATMLNEKEKEKVRAKMKWLQSNDIKIYNKQHNVDDIVREIRKRAEGRGVGKYIAMIDYLQLVTVTDQNKNRHLQVGEVTRKLKLLGNELNVPIVLLSQLNRGLEHRQDKRPTKADLRESGDIEQDADIILFLHPDDEDEGLTNVIVAKNRDGQADISVPFRFFKSTGRFEEEVY
ncbi:replicative DNA helicase [Jeotgalibaca sp. A127]|uniref:replicative DNA helicase n=1 Tax=Jeotgalibaca sp. A127 TaxID=3457324 RepID=UPI003FD5911E